jgi:hypothetical protein
MASVFNTSYRTKSDVNTEDERLYYNIEEGAFVHTSAGVWTVWNGEWVKLYPQAGEGTMIGWVRYDDTEYTSLNKLALTDGVETHLPNNGGLITKSHDVIYYNIETEKVFGDTANDVYTLTVIFKASSPQTVNTHLDFTMTGVVGYDRINKSLSFSKGNNEEQNFHEVYQYYVNQDFITNGAELRIMSHGGDASIWDIIYFIQKTQSYA